MALISCAECDREFSDKAAACPQCAAPIDVARADSKGASMPRMAHSGRLERRSHNEILIRAPGEQAFEHVRDALALMVDSIRVSTTPLSISADVQVEKPPAAAEIRVLFEIPDSSTTLIKIEETSGPGGSSMAAQRAIELVAKSIMEHAGESFHRKPNVSRNIGAKLNNIDTDTGTERENDLLDCPACGGPLAKTATSCPKCGAANTWLHPEIQRFIDAEAALKLPSSIYHYGALWIRFTSLGDWHDDVLAIDFSVTPPSVTTKKPKYWRVVLAFFGLLPESVELDSGASARPAAAGQSTQLKVFAGIAVGCVAVVVLAVMLQAPAGTSVSGNRAAWQSQSVLLDEIWSGFTSNPKNTNARSRQINVSGRMIKEGTVSPAAINSSASGRLPAYLACYDYVQVFVGLGDQQTKLCIYYIDNPSRGTYAISWRGPEFMRELESQMAADEFRLN